MATVNELYLPDTDACHSISVVRSDYPSCITAVYRLQNGSSVMLESIASRSVSSDVSIFGRTGRIVHCWSAVSTSAHRTRSTVPSLLTSRAALTNDKTGV